MNSGSSLELHGTPEIPRGPWGSQPLSFPAHQVIPAVTEGKNYRSWQSSHPTPTLRSPGLGSEPRRGWGWGTASGGPLPFQPFFLHQCFPILVLLRITWARGGGLGLGKVPGPRLHLRQAQSDLFGRDLGNSRGSHAGGPVCCACDSGFIDTCSLGQGESKAHD